MTITYGYLNTLEEYLKTFLIRKLRIYMVCAEFSFSKISGGEIIENETQARVVNEKRNIHYSCMYFKIAHIYM